MVSAARDRRSIAAALAVVLIWSTSFSLAKDAIVHLGPWVFRFCAMAVGLLPLLPWVRRSIADARRMEPRPRRRLLLAVVANGTVVSSVNMLALAWFPASSVLTMMYTMPAFTSVIVALQTRQWSPLGVAAPLAALAGVAVYAGDALVGAGALLVLANALLWALGTRWSGQATAHCQPFTAVTLQMLIAFVASVPLLLIELLPSGHALPMPRVADVVGVLYAGLFNGALVFWLWYVAIAGLGALRASWFTLLVPVLGSAFAALFYAEVLGLRQWLGIALVSLSLLLQGLARRRATG